jgi:hypothetical protein
VIIDFYDVPKGAVPEKLDDFISVLYVIPDDYFVVAAVIVKPEILRPSTAGLLCGAIWTEIEYLRVVQNFSLLVGR